LAVCGGQKGKQRTNFALTQTLADGNKIQTAELGDPHQNL